MNIDLDAEQIEVIGEAMYQRYKSSENAYHILKKIHDTNLNENIENLMNEYKKTRDKNFVILGKIIEAQSKITKE